MPDAVPHLTWQSFTAPKAGSSTAELEDALAGDLQTGRFAVADGASESAFAGTWANLLVEHYVHERGRWSTWLPLAQEEWRKQCERDGLPWYLEEKLAEGAFATFLGVSFRGPKQWQATAVGDACVFQVRDGRLNLAFPMDRSQDFSSRPTLLCSRPNGIAWRTKRLRLLADWREHDILLLATDALAQWFLKKVEQGGQPWLECRELACQMQFQDWMHTLRNAKEIRNDDVALMVIT